MATAVPLARAVACAWLVLALTPAPSAAASPGVLLDVPYLAQTEQLCGGASAAMIQRYWGHLDAAPQDFSRLVERTRGGIRTSVLAGTLAGQGWQVTRLATGVSSSAAIRAELEAARPVLALIEDRPGAYHYIVVVGFTADAVVFHDPARAPFRVMPAREFDRRSASAGSWMAIVQPGPDTVVARVRDAAPADTARDISSPATACTPVIEASVVAARAGDVASAERGLLDALTRCPQDADAWRELGGLRFVQRRYTDSFLLVETATRLAPEDRDAWQLLGSAQYLRENLAAALDAWNRIDAPRIRDIAFTGLARTRHPAAIATLGLTAGDVLTAHAFQRAARRLGEMPTVVAAGLRFQPLPATEVTVDATVVERPLVPSGWPAWGALGLSSALRREVQLDLASPTGAGELWTGSYRWTHNRPRVRFALSVPPIPRVAAFVTIDAMWERQAYRLPGAVDDAPFHQERRRAGLTLANWSTRWLRWQAGTSVDRVDTARYLSLDGRIVVRGLGDRTAAVVNAGRWFARDNAGDFGAADAALWWRSTPRTNTPAWSARAGYAYATRLAPLAVWPAAGASDGRGMFLRGHTTFDDGVIVTPALGRALTFMNIEYTHPAYANVYGTAALAAFVDVARATDRLDGGRDDRAQVDIGVGLRLGTPMLGGPVRIDAAYGVRDGAAKFSAGYVLPWGR